MHELSLCQSIYRIADRARAGQPVTEVRLQVGMLRQVVPHTLEYCWGLVTEQTPLAGSRLAIDHVPIRLRCRACGRATDADRLVLACAHCGGGDVEVVAGEEFLLTSMDLGRTDDGAVPPAR